MRSPIAPVTARAVSFELPDGRALFTDLDLSLPPGLTALVGPNGVGKTTLARLLAGDLSPARGAVRRDAPVALFPQHEAPPGRTVAALLADLPWTPARHALTEGLPPDARCDALSGGQWMRVRLARLPDDAYLILDEPTNDLDGAARRALFAFLRARSAAGEGALIISHDRECLALCDEVLELSGQGLARFGGGWTDYERVRDAERDRAARALAVAARDRDRAAAKRRAQRERQEARNRRGARDAKRGGQPKILLGLKKRAAEGTTGRLDATTRDRLDEAVHAARAAFEALKTDALMHPALAGRALPAQRLVAEARGFNIRRGGRRVFSADLDFAWRGNARVAVTGPNGAGKSTLLRALADGAPEGVYAADDVHGTLRRGDLAAVVIDPHGTGLDETRNVLDNLRAATGLPDGVLRDELAGFLFTGDAVFQTVGTLSGGERLRAALALGMLRPAPAGAPELLILDEPTNNLDLPNIRLLERIVARFEGAVIVASHDTVFLENCRVEEWFEIAGNG